MNQGYSLIKRYSRFCLQEDYVERGIKEIDDETTYFEKHGKMPPPKCDSRRYISCLPNLCSSCSFPFLCVLPLSHGPHPSRTPEMPFVCKPSRWSEKDKKLCISCCSDGNGVSSSSSTFGNPFFLRCHCSALMCRYVEGGFGLDMFDDLSRMS